MKKMLLILLLLSLVGTGYILIRPKKTNQLQEVTSITSLDFKNWLSDGEANDKDIQNIINDDKWNTSTTEYTFDLVSEGRIFIGSLNDKDIEYGRIYSVKRNKENFELKAEKLIATKSIVEAKFSDKIKAFTPLKEDSVSDSFIKEKNIDSLTISDVKESSPEDKINNLQFKLYLIGNDTLIRESKQKNSSMSNFMKYKAVK